MAIIQMMARPLASACSAVCDAGRPVSEITFRACAGSAGALAAISERLAASVFAASVVDELTVNGVQALCESFHGFLGCEFKPNSSSVAPINLVYLNLLDWGRCFSARRPPWCRGDVFPKDFSRYITVIALYNCLAVHFNRRRDIALK